MESTIHVSHPPIFIPWESGIPLPSVTAILVPLDVSTRDRHCFSMGVLARMGSGAFLGGGLGAEVEGSGFVDLGGCGFCGELLWGGFLGGEFMGFGVSLCVFFFFFAFSCSLRIVCISLPFQSVHLSILLAYFFFAIFLFFISFSTKTPFLPFLEWNRKDPYLPNPPFCRAFLFEPQAFGTDRVRGCKDRDDGNENV